MIGLTAMMVSFIVVAFPGMPAVLALPLGMAIGAVLGSLNGLIVAGGGVPPIIATLGLYGVWRTLIYLLLGGRWLSGLPDLLGWLVRPTLLGVPVVALELLLLYALGWLALRRTPLGVWWLACGGNEPAARLAGVPTGPARAAAFALSGTLAGLAGTFYVAQYRNVEMTTGGTLALDAIVAAVLGGASVTGGRASLVGTALGVLLVRILQNGFVLVGVPSLWEEVVVGGLLLLTLALERPALLLRAGPA
jgi:ribose/xylose/arabinose/galactoside ABC-type transport system permease subunit